MIHLKVGIYLYIPDLAKDDFVGLKGFIKKEFEQEHPDISLTLCTNWKPYDLDLYDEHLSAEDTSYDILETDTVFLGEIVDKGLLQEIDPHHHNLHDNLPVGIEAVTYNGRHYGIPTLQCANFLIELIAGDADPEEEVLCRLETGDHNLGDFKKVIKDYNYDHFQGVSPLIGEFRGKWTLPCFYLDAYIDKHGEDSVQEGVDAPVEETDVFDAIKWFMKLDEDTDGVNKGVAADKPYEDPTKRDSSIAKSDHVMLYGFSEWLSLVMVDKMCQKKKIHATCIISPPLGAENNLLTFTDALVVNKIHYCSDNNKARAIDKFIKFYTSLKFRNQYAAGKDLKEPHPPRYVMISRKDFYTQGFGADQKHYPKLFLALKDHAVAAPNYGLASRKDEINSILVSKLNLPKAKPQS